MGITYDLNTAHYTRVNSSYKYARLPSEGMNTAKKKADKWLRHNARKYGFVLPIRMTNERHHWEYIGVNKAQSLNTYIDFKMTNITNEDGSKATAPTFGKSFSLRRTDISSKKNLYIKKECD